MKKDKITIFVISFILPILVCVVLKLWHNHISYNVYNFDGIEIVKTLLGIWATLLGFIITATSILVTMGGKEFIQAFRNSKHYSTVLLTYCFSSFAFLISTIFGVIVVCINIWNEILFYTLVYLIISTLSLLFFCVLFLFFMILKSI